jgi:hypothetical protein
MAPSPFSNSLKIKSPPISPPVEIDLDNKIPSRQETKNFVKNGNNLQSDSGHLIIGRNMITLDDKIIKELELLCYKKDYLIKSLSNNEINYATSAYYLLFQYGLDSS